MPLLKELLTDEVIGELEGLSALEAKESVSPMADGLTVVEAEEIFAREESRLEISIARLADHWRAAAAGNEGCRHFLTLALQGRDEAHNVFRAFEPEVIEGADSEALAWMEKFAENFSEMDRETFTVTSEDNGEWDYAVACSPLHETGRPATIARKAALKGVLGRASVGDEPADSGWWSPIPLSREGRRRLALSVARDKLGPAKVFNALSLGTLYRKVQDVLDIGLSKAVEAAETDLEMARALGAMGEFQKDLPAKWRKWLAGCFPNSNLPANVVCRVVYNACEDNPRWREALRFRAEVEAVAAAIYMAVFHRTGPFYRKDPIKWNKAAKTAAGIIGYNDRRIPKAVAERLRAVSSITEEKAHGNEFWKVKVFSLKARDLDKLRKSRKAALARFNELKRWKGGARRRWKLMATAVGIL